MFVKHHRWGKPKLRLVFLSPELHEIYWVDPKMSAKPDQGKIKGKILTKDIKEIRSGFIKSKKGSLAGKRYKLIQKIN